MATRHKTAVSDYRAYIGLRGGRGMPLPDPPQSYLDNARAASDDVVYFIRSGETGPIKIGHATRAEARMAHLQTGNPHAMTILATLPGGAAMERVMHTRFHTLRRGSTEWFDPGPVLLAFIDGIRWGTRSGLVQSEAETLAQLEQENALMRTSLRHAMAVLDGGGPHVETPIWEDMAYDEATRFFHKYRHVMKSVGIATQMFLPDVGSLEWMAWASHAVWSGQPVPPAALAQVMRDDARMAGADIRAKYRAEAIREQA